jgi:hypothetical protein
MFKHYTVSYGDLPGLPTWVPCFANALGREYSIFCNKTVPNSTKYVYEP